MTTSNIKQAILLSAVTATGAGTGVGAQIYRFFFFSVIASVITTGGTIRIEGMNTNGDWVPVTGNPVSSTITVSANGNSGLAVCGVFQQVRANVVTRTDGTYTVYMDAAPSGRS